MTRFISRMWDNLMGRINQQGSVEHPAIYCVYCSQEVLSGNVGSRGGGYYHAPPAICATIIESGNGLRSMGQAKYIPLSEAQRRETEKRKAAYEKRLNDLSESGLEGKTA